MNKRIIHDSSNLIWFDFENLDIERLENTVLSHFDITNMPAHFSRYDICGNPIYEFDNFELKNYWVTFYKDHKSKTGWSCMCINPNREIFKSKIGYNADGTPSQMEY